MPCSVIMCLIYTSGGEPTKKKTLARRQHSGLMARTAGLSLLSWGVFLHRLQIKAYLYDTFHSWKQHKVPRSSNTRSREIQNVIRSWGITVSSHPACISPYIQGSHASLFCTRQPIEAQNIHNIAIIKHRRKSSQHQKLPSSAAPTVEKPSTVTDGPIL